MSAGQPGAGATSLSNSQSLDGLIVNGLNGKDSNGNASSGILTEDEGRKRDSIGLPGAMALPNLNNFSIGGESEVRENAKKRNEKENAGERMKGR